MLPPRMNRPAVLLCCWLPLLLVTTSAADQQSPVVVTTAAAGELRYLPLISVPATTLSLGESRVSPRTPGFIVQLPVRVGDQIKQDELLAELDCTTNLSQQREAEAARESAAAQLNLAQRQIRRTKTLREERNISEETLNQRETDLETARAELNRAAAALEKVRYDVLHCRITAPFSGVVLERLAAEGEWIAPGQPVVRLVDTERLEVSAQIPLHQADSLIQAKQLELLTDGESYRLKLRHLLPLVDMRGRNREARMEFTGNSALPGSSGRMQWRADEFHLPADIPVRRGGKLGVMLEQNGSARFLPLESALEGHPAAIDLPPETRIILQGRQKVADGEKVQVSAGKQDAP